MDFHSYVRLLEVNMRGWKTMFIYKNKLSFPESMFNSGMIKKNQKVSWIQLD